MQGLRIPETPTDDEQVAVVIPTAQGDCRWQVLAGLRFLLAMVVVAGHLSWYEPMNSPPSWLATLGGTSAVLGFLVISGYSIGHSLNRRPRGFFQRRLLRIYPLYVVAVLYSLVPFWSGAELLTTMSPFVTIARPHMWVVIGNLLMLQNIVCPPVNSNILVWTLGIEVICYLLAPRFRQFHTAILLVLIAVSASAFGLLYPHMARHEDQHYATLKWGLPLLMFAWAWIGGFVLQRCGTSIFFGIAMIALSVVLLKLNTAYAAPNSVACLIGAVSIVVLSPHVLLPRVVGSLLNYLGDLSYPLYLFHLPTFLLGYGVMSIDNSSQLLAMALIISAAFLLLESILKPVISRRWIVAV